MIGRLIAVLLLTLSLAVVASPVQVHYTPQQGDYFTYYEVENLGNGTGNYNGYAEHTTVTGTERINSVGSNGVVSAYYHYSWTYSNSTGGTQNGQSSGNYTFSDETFLYLNGTDNQTGYVNPTLWYYINNSLPVGSTFYLLDTQMTVESRNFSYSLPGQDRKVESIFAQGKSSYLRNDSYGYFNAQYTWDSYFDPSTGYIIGYVYTEHDSNSSGSGFTYTDTLNVNSTSYPLTTNSAASTRPGTQLPVSYIEIFMTAVLVLAVVVVTLALFRRKKQRIPKHSQEAGAVGGRYDSIPSQSPPTAPPQSIDLTPKEPPVQQIVVKEVVKVKCAYCGALIDSTAQTCPECGAPRT